jgi:beta-glucosidase
VSGHSAVRARADGAWAAFHDVDLGAGAAACHLSVNAGHAATVRLRLDDPGDGPTLAVVDVPAGEDRYGFTAVRAPLVPDGVPARGIRDVYLVFERSGTAVAALGFSRD